MKGEGYLMIDHRSSPGLTEEHARTLGMPAKQLGEGALFEAATLKCHHCPTPFVFIVNPARKRPRHHCKKCKGYICDHCAEFTKTPDYVHRSFKQIADLVMNGQFTVSGTTSCPILTPKGA